VPSSSGLVFTCLWLSCILQVNALQYSYCLGAIVYILPVDSIIFIIWVQDCHWPIQYLGILIDVIFVLNDETGCKIWANSFSAYNDWLFHFLNSIWLLLMLLAIFPNLCWCIHPWQYFITKCSGTLEITHRKKFVTQTNNKQINTEASRGRT